MYPIFVSLVSGTWLLRALSHFAFAHFQGLGLLVPTLVGIGFYFYNLSRHLSGFAH